LLGRGEENDLSKKGGAVEGGRSVLLLKRALGARLCKGIPSKVFLQSAGKGKKNEAKRGERREDKHDLGENSKREP